MKYDDFKVGDCAYFQKTISESDVYLYAGITGDFNPVHVDKKTAESGRFKQRISHGMLLGGLISSVLGTKLPGEGAIYVSQEINFLLPVFFGDTIKAEVTIIEKLEKGRVRLKTTCYNQKDEIVADGFATLLVPRT